MSSVLGLKFSATTNYKYNRRASKQSEAINSCMQDLDIFLLCTEELEIFYLDSFISNNTYSTKLGKTNPGEEI